MSGVGSLIPDYALDLLQFVEREKSNLVTLTEFGCMLTARRAGMENRTTFCQLEARVYASIAVVKALDVARAHVEEFTAYSDQLMDGAK